MKEDKAFSLVEILIAATILAVCLVPVISIFITGRTQIAHTDTARKYRFFVDEILARIDRTSLHTLWNYFGPKGFNVAGFGASGKFRDRLAEYDSSTMTLFAGTPGQVNPLGFSEDFLRQMTREGLEGQIAFEFFTKKGLMIRPGTTPGAPGIVDKRIGIMHMQAGFAKVHLIDLKTHEALTEEVHPVMCPAIVGRPGLKLQSCPAISPNIHAIYDAILEQYEAGLGDPPPW